MFQGPEELDQLNWQPFAFPAEALSAVVLTHAHLDHVGRLPRLVAQGFQGPVYCSRASRGLISLVLRDAAHLQEEAALQHELGWARPRLPVMGDTVPF